MAQYTRLYLHNEYVLCYDDLVRILKDTTARNNDTFIEELLAVARDGVLSEWLTLNGKSISFDDGINDNELFEYIVREITGESEFKVTTNLFMKKYAELISVKADDKELSNISNATIKIGEKSPATLCFTFRSNVPSNEDFVFTLKDNKTGNTIGNRVLETWRDKSKGREVTIYLAVCSAENFSLMVNDNVIRKFELGKEKGATSDELTFNVDGVEFKMIRVEAGSFMMGGENAKPVHKVNLTKDYYMGETQVTQALWQAVMGNNPSRNKGDNKPVERVSWDDCQEFIQKLNKKTGKKFRLPTEAEWEFAARGGNKSQGYIYAGSNDLDKVGWYDGNCSKTQNVRKKQPNELGIYDMSGNVWEWCEDRYGDYPSKEVTDPHGPSSGSYRVLRGGGYFGTAGNGRVSFRFNRGDCYCNDRGGLRLAY